MKAVMVIEMPENCSECLCEQNGICLVKSNAVESIDRPLWCPLRPLPQKKDVPPDYGMMYGNPFGEGWNACIDEITGNTDKENLNDTADIIRKWGRYCVCGEKMMPNTAGGWYCPVCHRTMKSILFKRVK